MLLVKKCKLPEVKQDTPQEPTVTIMSKDLPAHAHQHYVSFAVLFEFDSDYVETFGENINSCIAICKSDSTLKMIIHGYTCDIGSEEYNHNLSKRRAENTKNLILTRYPFMHDRIEIIGWGENFPDSLKIANRAQNRRVDIELIQYE